MTTPTLPLAGTERGAGPVADAVAATAAWWHGEQRQSTLVDDETLWRETHLRYLALNDHSAGGDRRQTWAGLASVLVSDLSKGGRHERDAVKEAAAFLAGADELPLAERAQMLHRIAERCDVEPARLLGLLGPGVGYPWVFSPALWSPDNIGTTVAALLAGIDWKPGQSPDSQSIRDKASGTSLPEFLTSLRARTSENSDVDRMLAAASALTAQIEHEGRDVAVVEPRTFLDGLAHHGLAPEDLERLRRPLCALREAVVLLVSHRLHQHAERYLAGARRVRDYDPDSAIEGSRRAANLYMRLAVAQKYPERILERHQQIWREIEAIRSDSLAPDRRANQVLLVSTFNSPGDLQRLLLSVAHELMAYAYGKTVHVIVTDDSTPEMRERNRRVIDDFVAAGLSISHWRTERKEEFLDQLNADVFPDGSFDVRALAGEKRPGDKGIPYGRLRNFLRLVALKEVREQGLDSPLLTWLDQDNEIGALVLTKGGRLSKRHVFNYFDQKSSLFEHGDMMVGGGGYTNDALEGVEKFWVAWGILHQTLDLAQRHDPSGPPIVSADPDITRFRPWDQPDTLERLPREGEAMATLSDQVMLLLRTLVGTFRGKYENQVQIYHPWSSGDFDPDDDLLVEQRRPFAGMPGGNTTFSTEVLRSPTPFITVGGRGEDIFHLWQLEASYGVGRIFLTHTPALHTRNVRSGRGDLMDEIINSYNGRILREPPLLWRALSASLEGRNEQIEADASRAETDEHVNNLRAEARSRIAEVSGFAAAIEPYIDKSSEFWWVHQVQTDETYREILSELREIVSRLKDVERYQAEAEQRLLGPDDVRQLTDQFVAAYPHWRTVVSHVGGEGATSESPRAAAVSPSAGYGSGSPEDAERTPAGRPVQHRTGPALADPIAEPSWHEVVSAVMSLFRRYELGRAQNDLVTTRSQRRDRLREIFTHYVGLMGAVPEFVWTMVYRDALLVPSSAQYAAVTTLLTERASSPDRRLGDADISGIAAVAAEFGVDEQMLREAVAAPVESVASKRDA